MATEIHREPPAAREPLTIHSAADRISGLLQQGQTEERGHPGRESREAPPQDEAPPRRESRAMPPEMPDEPADDEAPEMDASEDEDEHEGEEAPRKDAKAEPDDGSHEDADELELEPAQLAHLLGVDESDLDIGEDGTLGYRVKVDGEQGRATLAELRDSYQLAKTHRQRLTQLGEERKAFQEERDRALQSLENQRQQLTQTVQTLADEFASDYQAIDWNRLREEDPTEYNVKRLDFEDRRRRIEQAAVRAQEQTQQLQQQFTQRLTEQQAEGRKKLEDVFSSPEYANAPKWDEAERKRLHDWIVAQGFRPEEISQVGVWQAFKWARDSMLREQEQSRAKETTKKIKRLPKIVKPGQPKPKAEVKRSQLQQLKARQRKQGGDLNSTADLIRGIFKS